MEKLIDSIRLALADDASDEARTTGATACRTILNVLEAKPGEPIAPVVNKPPEAPLPIAQIANVVNALRGMPTEQIFDLAIARLRAALPAGVDVPPVKPLKFHLIAPPRMP